jgi:DNA-binding MarR family transcriptional regulator/GNAT superfamily N-acetyltransferase
MLSPEEHFRRFARAVTTEVGALDDSFLGRGRPLGAARVLNAIGRGREDVAEIRRYLQLDSGLMSRLLRSLEREGLIRTEPDPKDARRRRASLTSAGQRECRWYDEVSNARALKVLTKHGNLPSLLHALDVVTATLMRDTIELTVTSPTSPEARYCLERYFAELAQTFDGGFDRGRARDPERTTMESPTGAFLVALQDRYPVGCVALVGVGGRVGEVKRLWVASCARGLGLGRRLMQAVEARAKALGYATLRLDTNRALPAAYELYRKTGWREIGRFNDDPYAHHFFEKQLQPARAERKRVRSARTA